MSDERDSPYRVRRAGNAYVIDNGTELLATCGCCGNAFTEHGARATVQRLETNVVLWPMLIKAAREWESGDEIIHILHGGHDASG
jgi:hypothetical protein